MADLDMLMGRITNMITDYEVRYCACCDDECDANPDYLLEVTTPSGEVLDVFFCEECYALHKA